jgi:hypothetical protein
MSKTDELLAQILAVLVRMDERNERFEIEAKTRSAAYEKERERERREAERKHDQVMRKIMRAQGIELDDSEGATRQ